MKVPDSIEREVILRVPPARVWTALTRADQLGACKIVAIEVVADPERLGQLQLEVLS